MNALDQIEPLAGLEGQIDDDQIGAGGLHQFQRVGDVLRFAAHRQVGLNGDASRQPFPDDRMIIDDQDLDLPGAVVAVGFIHEWSLDRAYM